MFFSSILQAFSNPVKTYLLGLEKAMQDKTFNDKIKAQLCRNYLTHKHVDIDKVLKLHMPYKEFSYNAHDKNLEVDNDNTCYFFKASKYPVSQRPSVVQTSTLTTKDWDKAIMDNVFGVIAQSGTTWVKRIQLVIVLTKVKNEETGKFNRVANIIVQDIDDTRRIQEVLTKRLVSYFKYLRTNCGIKYVQYPDSGLIEIPKD